MNTAHPGAAREEEVGVKVSEVGKIAGQVVNKTHMVVSINPGKLYPLATEYLVIREANSQV